MQEIIKDSAVKLFGKKISIDLEVAWTMSDDDEDVMKETEQDDAEETEQHQSSSPEDVEFDPSISPESGNPKTPSIDEETVKQKDSDKTLKKPDKILPCPRCKSMDTKFCYYNNYNVNQPRHFCKSCQRYWTSGGTMRNVPVGAGRRKSKNSSFSTSVYPQICISDSLHHPHQYPNSRNHGTVLSFSSDSRTKRTLAMNINDDSSSDSTVTTMSNRNEELSHPNLSGYGVPPPWSYNMATVPFYPFWTCPFPAPWNLPCPPLPSPQPHLCSDKRFRKGDDSEQERPKKVLAPKTLRMDDPNEAAKSSILATLGIKNDCVPPKGVFFQGFEKTLSVEGETPAVLYANPAALSRSLNFHERH